MTLIQKPTNCIEKTQVNRVNTYIFSVPLFEAEQLISEHEVCVTGLQKLEEARNDGVELKSNIDKKRTECDGILKKLKQNGSSRAKTYVVFFSNESKSFRWSTMNPYDDKTAPILINYPF